MGITRWARETKKKNEKNIREGKARTPWVDNRAPNAERDKRLKELHATKRELEDILDVGDSKSVRENVNLTSLVFFIASIVLSAFFLLFALRRHTSSKPRSKSRKLT